MKILNASIFLKRITAILGFLFFAWVSFYCVRSSRGSYHEIVHAGGSSSAIWFPDDFNPHKIAEPVPEYPKTKQPRKRYAPQTRLPDSHPLDWPLLIIDRLLFHESTTLTSGQGDMPRLHEISDDGKSLIPVK